MLAEFILHYDISKEKFDYSTFIVSIFQSALVFSLFYIMRKKSKLFVFLSYASGVLGVILIITHLLTIFEHNDLKQRLIHNECKVAEGFPINFKYREPGSHDVESFYLNGDKFEYAEGLNNGLGFNVTAAHGGPIKAGVYIKIHYFKNHILRLETRN